MKFGELDFIYDPETAGGGMSRATHEFENGYGASVIIGHFSYGGREGLYELAVLHNDSLCYDTHITDDVIGYLTKEEVEGLLDQIAALPPKEKEND